MNQLRTIAFAFYGLSFAMSATVIGVWVGWQSALQIYEIRPDSLARLEVLIWLFASIIVFVFAMPLIYLYVIRRRSTERRLIYYFFVIAPFAVPCIFLWMNGVTHAPYFFVLIMIAWILFFEYARWVDSNEARALPALVAGMIAVAVDSALIVFWVSGQILGRHWLPAAMLAAWLIPVAMVVLTDFFRPRTGAGRGQRPEAMDQTRRAG